METYSVFSPHINISTSKGKVAGFIINNLPFRRDFVQNILIDIVPKKKIFRLFFIQKSAGSIGSKDFDKQNDLKNKH